MLSHESDLGLSVSESSEEDKGDREPFLGEALGFPASVQVPFSAVRLQ